MRLRNQEVMFIYQALYRKYRPQKFGDVVGQEGITSALAAQIAADKIGHAYLFTGTRGTGKTTCAKIFARAVNCENRTGAEPCGECVLCKGMDDGSILDVVEMDAASNRGIDDVRDLRDETVYRPSRGRYRVYIVDEVHMMTKEAFNALLKIMEEPPEHLIFILATTEIHKVPATILSRCQRFDFMRIPAGNIAGRLLEVAGQEDIALDPAAAALVARLADGSMRDALSLLDTCGGLGEAVDEALVRKMAGVSDKDYLFDVSRIVAEGDIDALLPLMNRLHNGSTEAARLCEELVHHYRSLMLAASAPDGSLLDDMTPAERQQYLQAATQVSVPAAINAMRRLAAAMDRMGRSPDPRIELELALFDLAESSRGGALAPPQPQRSAAPVEKPQPTQVAPVAKPPEKNDEKTEINRTENAPAPEPAPAEPAAPAPFDDSTALPASVPTTESAEVAAEPSAATTPDGPAPFEQWPQVLALMAQSDRMLSSFMNGTTAYVEGKRVLIDAGQLFFEYVRKNEESREKIKAAIQQVSGVRYGIGPYEAKKAEEIKQPTAEETLRDWEQKGVQITYE